MAALDDLMALVPPPSGVTPVNWDGIVLPGGAVPPADYRALVDAYGHGSFDDFLSVLQPSSPNRYLDLRHQIDVRIDALRVLRDDGEEMPYEIDDPATHIVPWAITGNGDTVYWRRAPGAPPEAWTIVVNEGRGPDWDAYDGPATQFLLDVLTRRVAIDVFPEDWPSANPRFERRG
jgi:hypothetical protein